MADSTPAWFLPPTSIAQQPFLQSWNGQTPPYANTMDQIQQSQAISGVFPGQMPDNPFLGNTAARYAFGRTLPGSSPYQGAMTSYMQGKGMPTGVPLGLLGLQNGIGQPPPPGSSGPPYPGGGSPGTYPPPGGQGGYGPPPPGGPAPPPFPGGAGGGQGTPPPSGGLLGGGGFTGGYQAPGLLPGQANDSQAPAPRGGRVIQSFTDPRATAAQSSTANMDPATKYMYAIANRIDPRKLGIDAGQVMALQDATRGSVFNRKTGQVLTFDPRTQTYVPA